MPETRVTSKQLGLRGNEYFRAFTDCIGNVNNDVWTYANSGTGSSLLALAVGVENALGILRGNLGTTATGRVNICSVNFNVLLFGKGKANYRGLFRFPNLSDATNTYTFRCGFIQAVVGESSHGVFFRYTHSVNSGKFEAVSRSNSTQTAQDTGITVAANTWYSFEINVAPDGSSAEFKINGSVVATITTNIPTQSGREFGYGFMCLRSAGTATYNAVDCDYQDVDYQFTTAR